MVSSAHTHYVFIEGEIAGPFSTQQIAQQFGPEILVSHNGSWKAMSDHPDFLSETPRTGKASVPKFDKPTSYVTEGEFRSLAIPLILVLIITRVILVGFQGAGFGAFHVIYIGSILALALLSRVKASTFAGNALLVTESSLPRLESIAMTCCARLGIERSSFRLLVFQSPSLDAFAVGFGRPYSVLVSSAICEQLDDQELASVVGHELGHIQNQHTVVSPFVSTGPVSVPIVSTIFSYFFLAYNRKGERTSDRAGLIASLDLHKTITALAKVHVGTSVFNEAGLESILKQITETSRDPQVRYAELVQTHPYLLNRISHLIEFAESDQYKEIVSLPENPASRGFLNIKKIPGLAAFASAIFEGAGQAYNGQLVKGLLFLLIAVAVVVIPWIGLLLYYPWFAYILFDAYKTAKKINEAESPVS